jgi:hypothetical protein
MKHFCLRLATLSMIVALVGFIVARANAQAVSPIPGALGQAQSVDANSITIGTKTGVVTVEITRPLTIYREVPSDLNHVTSSSYVGVASEEGPNGVEIAKKIWIFPPELSGAVEGSVLTDPAPGTATRSRMTNGSVSRPAAQPRSRMTNGVAQKGKGTTLIVNYQDGSKAITVPANVQIVDVVPGDVTPKAGDIVYAATFEQSNGKLATNKIGIFSLGPAPKKAN